MEPFGGSLTRNLALTLTMLGTLGMVSGCGDGGDEEGSTAVENTKVVAYVKQSEDDQGWYLLDPVTTTDSTLVPSFGADLWPEVTTDGSRITTADASDTGGYTIRDGQGNPIGDVLYGDSFGWNPSGNLGAYNLGDFSGPIAVVDNNGEPAPEWNASAAEDSATGDPIDLSQLAFYSWVSDEVMFVTLEGYAALARMDGDNLSVTKSIDIENPNYPVFDRLGNGTFVDQSALRQIDVQTGAIEDLATFEPAPESDYIVRNVSWSPVASKFSYVAPGSSQICDWNGILTCEPAQLPPGFTSEGANFSLDNETVAFNGYMDYSDANWHPFLVNLSTLKARPLPFKCEQTCYLYAFVADSSTSESIPDGADDPPTAEDEPSPEMLETSESTDLTSRPIIEGSAGEAPSALVTEDIVEGTGPAISPGDQVSVQYVGALFDSGEVFDSSWDRGEPFSFEVGAGSVIQGLDEGMAGMKAGGRRKLVIPPDLAYGQAGSPPTIPPDAALVFVVDLLSR